MPRPTGPEMRQMLLDAALTLFCARGYEGTALQGVADAVGVTKAAIYNHFPSKAALLDAVATPGIDAFRAALEAAGDGPLTPDARRDLVGRVVDVLLAHRRVVVWLTRDVAALAQPGVAGRIAANAERLYPLLVGAQAGLAGHVRAVAAYGAIVRPIATASFADDDLAAARGTLVAAALAVLAGDPSPR